MPVIMTLEVIDHALTAVGYVETQGSVVRAGQSYDTFVRALVVHDDQRGPYRLMPVTEADIDHLPRDCLLTDAGDILCAETSVSHMFVPLPERVYLRGDRADTVAKDYLQKQAEAQDLLTEAGAQVAEVFYANAQRQGVVRRTYLTSSAKYRFHLGQSGAAPAVKSRLRELREQRSVTQEELARRVDLSRTSITNIERGRQRVMLHQMVELAEALEATPEELMPKDLAADERALRPDVARVI